MAEQDNIDSETDALDHILDRLDSDNPFHFDVVGDGHVEFHVHAESGKIDAESRFFLSIKSDLSEQLKDSLYIESGSGEFYCPGASTEETTTYVLGFN